MDLEDLLAAISDAFWKVFDNARIYSLAEMGNHAANDHGVYALYYSRVRYVGKSVSLTLSLRGRLRDHANTLRRHGYNLDDVWCCWVVLPRWFCPAAEALLMERFEPDWNESGFGRHVPGAGRPGVRESKWDQWHANGVPPPVH